MSTPVAEQAVAVPAAAAGAARAGEGAKGNNGKDADAVLDNGADLARMKFHRHHAFIIGINAYQHVSPLNTAVADATRLAELLGAQHHFQVHPPLLDATGAQLRELLAHTMASAVAADDRVLFYFAGHGIAADGDDGPAGYIVPADARPGDLTSFIPMADLQAALDALPCRHLLLVLDCCFSGAFKWSSQHRAISGLMPKRLYDKRFDRFVADPARQIITSAAYDQKALDVLEGKATGARGEAVADDGRAHSPFALALFDALAGKADVRGEGEGDGVITATEVYAYIRDRIEPATLAAGERLRQTPSFFPLKGHDKGEFVFLHPHHRLNLPPVPLRSPYKGLASFEETDAHLFYGRDRVIKELADKAADPACRLLVVVGPSGTGKSSVIKAGLLPRLKKQGLVVLPVMRPGEQPLQALEQALEQAGRSLALPPGSTAPAGPADAAVPSGPVSPPRGAVLLIDQYEELITRCADPQQRIDFDARLHALLQAPGPLERVIITVRSDFEPQLNGGALKAAWKAGRCTVPPFSLDELREVIVMPTLQEVLIFDPPELVDQIIGEVVQSPGVLPLLSYALNELYEACVKSGRGDRALKQQDYEQLGGVMGALRNKADRLHASLDPGPEQDTMRRIMLRMVSVEGELAGRRVPMRDLDFPQVGQATVDKVVDQLVDSRLVVRSEDAIEPAHDALVRAWKTLRDWIHEAGRDKLILADQLNEAVQAHEATRNPDYLWHDNPQLPLVRSLLADAPRCWLNRREAAFVQASVQRRTRRLRLAVFGTAAVFAVVTGLMIWGWVKQTQAVGTIAEARNLSDDLMFKVVDELGRIPDTRAVRENLVDRVGLLQEKLGAAGAGDDRSTRFWQSVLKGDFSLEDEQLEPAERWRQAGQHYRIAMAIALDRPPGDAPAAEPPDTAAEAALDPNWQRNLSVAYGKLGELAEKAAGGEADEGAKAAALADARAWYARALSIDTRLAALQPTNRMIQNDLLVSLLRMGGAQRLQHLQMLDRQAAEAARTHLGQALELARRLSGEPPQDPLALRQAFTSQRLLGMVAYDLADQSLRNAEADRAAAELGAALALAERYPQEVLEHASLQYDLSEAYSTLADLHLAQGRPVPSLRAATRAAERARPQALADPGHPTWRAAYMAIHGAREQAAAQSRDGETLQALFETGRADAAQALARHPDDEQWLARSRSLDGQTALLPELLRLMKRGTERPPGQDDLLPPAAEPAASR